MAAAPPGQMPLGSAPPGLFFPVQPVLFTPPMSAAPPVSGPRVTWQAMRSSDGKHVFYHRQDTGESTWLRPMGPTNVVLALKPALAVMAAAPIDGTDWHLVRTTQGPMFFFQRASGTSTWAMPAAVATADLTSAQRKLGVLKRPRSPDAVEGQPEAKRREGDGGGGGGAGAADADAGDDDERFSIGSDDSGDSGDAGGGVGGVGGGDEDNNNNDNDNNDDDGEDATPAPNPARIAELRYGGMPAAQRVVQFQALLREHAITAFSSWVLVQDKLRLDPRFFALTSEKDRTAVFEHFRKACATASAGESASEQAERARRGFLALLAEHAAELVPATSTLYDVQALCGKDSRFTALTKEIRLQLFTAEMTRRRHEAAAAARGRQASAPSKHEQAQREQRSVLAAERAEVQRRTARARLELVLSERVKTICDWAQAAEQVADVLDSCKAVLSEREARDVFSHTQAELRRRLESQLTERLWARYAELVGRDWRTVGERMAGEPALARLGGLQACEAPLSTFVEAARARVRSDLDELLRLSPVLSAATPLQGPLFDDALAELACDARFGRAQAHGGFDVIARVREFLANEEYLAGRRVRREGDDAAVEGDMV